MVCPATDNHVKKYQRQETFLVEETDADYRSITLPYIEKHCLSVQVGGAGAREAQVNVSASHYLWDLCHNTLTLTVGLQHPGEEGRG